MKFLAALALLSVAMGAQIQPVTLPRAALPEVVESDEVPFNAVRVIEFADVVPVESAESQPQAPSGDAAPFDTVRIVDYADLAAPLNENAAVGVKVVSLEEIAALLANSPIDAPVDAVKVVDYADISAPVAENAEGQRVKIVSFEDIAALVAEAPVDAVKVVDVAVDAVAPVVNHGEDMSVLRNIDTPPRRPGKVFDNPLWR